jgi:hypothetical protein
MTDTKKPPETRVVLPVETSGQWPRRSSALDLGENLR